MSEVDGEGMACASAYRDGAYLVWVMEPGRYRVTFHDIPGYAPVEAHEAQIQAGRTTHLEIELQE